MSNEDHVPVPPSSPPKPAEKTVQPPQRPPYAPPFLWRLGSAAVMGFSGVLCRSFLLACTSKLEVHGLDRFLQLLDERGDVEGRTRGLITVSNHLSVIDDPLIWGMVPFRYMWSPDNLRWGLGSHDLMFKNKATSLFFTLGQCLPTHRIQHSRHGGLFQPAMTQAIRMLSSQPFARPAPTNPSAETTELPDPFTHPTAPPLHPTFTTTGRDSFPSPSYYPTRRHAWIHIFPEGRIHQHPAQAMRYFRWGVARLILESEPCPDVVPVWIEGFQDVMSEDREWPRPVPRSGKEVRVFLGERVDVDGVFGDYRKRWRGLVEESKRRQVKEQDGSGRRKWVELGILEDEWLRYGEEAVKLRVEVTKRVRDEVVKLRRERGWEEEDSRMEVAEAWELRKGDWGATFVG